MEVFDSNIWIYALTRSCAEPVRLVETAVDGEIPVAVNAYIFDEVMRNLGRSENRPEIIDRAKTRFAEILYGCRNIDSPNRREIRAMNIDAVRDDPTVQTMGTALGIQSKDVPVLVLAVQYADSNRATEYPVTIHTADHEFAQFDPTHYFPNVEMRYIDCSERTGL